MKFEMFHEEVKNDLKSNEMNLEVLMELEF